MESNRTEDDRRLAELSAMIEKLRVLHRPMGKPQPGDWLSVHPEREQTFREYVYSHPIIPNAHRRIIYIQPLGYFTDTQERIISLTGDFISLYYNLPVTIRDELPASAIPGSARRRHPAWGMEQILTGYVLDEILLPRLPDDAFAYIAFTAVDLWPGAGWNFVFGQASLRERVGVWSIYRNGDPHASEEDFRLCLMRTMKTAVHEIGHMCSIPHCIRYRCNMNGSNSREENDRRPLWLGPECLAKLCWAVQADPLDRYMNLLAFCRDQKFEKEEEFYAKSLEFLGISVRQER